ncbi:MAG: aminopeptidase N [Azospirillum sp.]|nr:aminopeptidase N [Azospirillum sp.]
MDKATPQAIHLHDYRPPDWLIDQIDLYVELGDAVTRVRAQLAVRRNPARAAEGSVPLVLNGEKLTLVSVAVDGRRLTPADYRLGTTELALDGLAESCRVETVAEINPQENLAFEGLYKTGSCFCTQCEAEGFRRITWFLDRPDVMARFTTTIVADPSACPVLLSNGNPVAAGRLDDGRHLVRWQDPFPKPCYLFALVAGDLAVVEDRFTTGSGREIALRIYVEHGNQDKCGHAMRSLKRAMAWDEERFGLEYDLDIFMIVAVGDFNMGAMENKGLNVFNSKYVLAKPDTATDIDFLGIETVVAHEYFHNWTGNRVTCRDWFQLSLKEGLTVFRDQEFSADMNSAAVKRINDVLRLRAGQFAEDAGALAHPVRPESYIEINNFYTATVYEKGAEVIRMIQTLVGRDGFRRGMDCYFARHDGQAVTCDDFVAAMADANGVDLGPFKLWYSQAGTPELTFDGQYDGVARRYTLTLRQSCPPTPGQPVKRPLRIPVALGLLGTDGLELPLRLAGEPASALAPTTRVLDLTGPEERFVFQDVPVPPVPSLLRGFSAPTRLVPRRPEAELAFLMAHDGDGFNRWEAGYGLATQLLLGLIEDWQAGRALVLSPGFIDAVGRLLDDAPRDRAFAALALTLPSEHYLAQQMAEIDVDAIHQVREFARRTLAHAHDGRWQAAYHGSASNQAFSVEPEAIGRRSLRNLSLAYLVSSGDPAAAALCLDQFGTATTMTETIAALGLIADGDHPQRQAVLDAFFERWQSDPLVVNKWLSLQATSQRPDTVAAVQALLGHPGFDRRNPNKLYALVGAFSANQVRFHGRSGQGYQFLADQVLALDPANPQVAARLAGPFARWRRFDPARRALMQGQLRRLVETPGLSPDVYEITSKSLAAT